MSLDEHFTIVGGAGFIGSKLFTYLCGAGASVSVPDRNNRSGLVGGLGHVLYCAGTTSDFRHRPFDTMEAHVSQLNKILRDGDFLSLTYLSSTRVYIHSDATSENARIVVQPNQAEDLFNISKLAGETLCINCGRNNVRAIRISNVLGEDFKSRNFAFDLMRAAAADGKIVLHSSTASEKDYVHIADIVEMVVTIARTGTAKLYNLASGANLTNGQIVEQIRQAIPAGLEVVANAPTIKFHPIDISRIVREFGFAPRPVLPYVRLLAERFRTGVCSETSGGS